MSEFDTTCMHCRWWKPTGYVFDEDRMTADQPGECRRRAPCRSQGPAWPVTRGGDVCGEFQHSDDRAARLLGTNYMNRSEGEAA